MVTQLGYEHLRRHDLRLTGLTWMTNASVPVRVQCRLARTRPPLQASHIGEQRAPARTNAVPRSSPMHELRLDQGRQTLFFVCNA